MQRPKSMGNSWMKLDMRLYLHDGSAEHPNHEAPAREITRPHLSCFECFPGDKGVLSVKVQVISLDDAIDAHNANEKEKECTNHGELDMLGGVEVEPLRRQPQHIRS